MDRLKKGKILLKILWRSFFLQAWWNFERLQSTGLLYTLLPLLNYLYRNDRDKLIQRKRSYEEYFNTNPIFFPIMLGALVKLEISFAYGRIKDDLISTFKVRMMSTLGAIGDTFGWAGLRPMTAFLGVISCFILSPVAGLIIYIIVYNTFCLFIRIKGFFLGYRYGVEIVDMIREKNPYKIVRIFFTVNAILASVVFSYLIFWYYTNQLFSFEGIFIGVLVSLFMVFLPGDFVILFYYIILTIGERLWPEILKI